MHVLILADNFPPERNAAASRVYERAKYWVQWGHRVTVVTSFPNFPEGRVFPGYTNDWYGTEVMDGIHVVRVKTFIAPNVGRARRVVDFLSYMVTGAAAGIVQSDVDVVLATSPQFFAGVAGDLVAIARRHPFVFEVADLWPASVTAVGAMRRGVIIRAAEQLELMLYRHARAIITLTPAFTVDLAARGVPFDKIHTIINGADLASWTRRKRDRELESSLSLGGKFVVGYIGTLGMAHALENVIAAAEQLRDRPDVRILFVGPGAVRESLIAECAKRRVDNVIFVPGQPKDRVSLYWDLCDVALVHLKNAAVFATVIPSKIFEAMAMGLPIVLAAPTGEASAIVARNGAGVVVPPEDPAALAATIRDLHDDDASRARYAESSARAAPLYTRQEQARRVMEVLVAAAS